MSARWQERKLEDDLLKQELVLRLLAEHYPTLGGTPPATERFHVRARRMMLRHPLFAVRYCLFALDLALGRLDDHDDDCGGGDADAGPAIAPGLTLEMARPGRPLPVRGVRVHRRDGRVVAASVLSGRERRPTWHLSLLRSCRARRLALFRRLAGLHGQILATLLSLQAYARRLRLSAVATLVDLAVRLYARRPVLRTRLVRLERGRRSVRAAAVQRALQARPAWPAWPKRVLRAAIAALTIPEASLGQRRPHALGAALIGALLIGGAATAVFRAHGSGPVGRSHGAAGAAPLSPLRLRIWHPRRPVPTRQHAVAVRPATHPSTPKRQRRQPHARQTILVADTVPTTSIPPAAPPTIAGHDAGPAPLPAPSSPSAPSPLKAP